MYNGRSLFQKETEYHGKLTPLMGRNSWNTFGADINEQLTFDTADIMVEKGFLAKGYAYLVIDDC